MAWRPQVIIADEQIKATMFEQTIRNDLDAVYLNFEAFQGPN